jgi:hypothetical protein
VTIKGVKLISNNNSTLSKKLSSSNKFSTVSVKQVESSPRKTNEMGAILGDYDKTKTFNQELIKNIGSPKGPIFARTQPKGQLSNSQANM